MDHIFQPFQSTYLAFGRNCIKINSFKEKDMSNYVLKKVLVIDCNEAILDVMRLIITDAGYNFVVPLSPFTPEKIFNLEPDLILIEDQLYNLQQGREISQSLKKSQLTSSIPIVIMTTSIKPENLILESEADTFLIKPFDIQKLEEILYCFSKKKN
ncbi:response regulator [uncultured Chryseobacterium sp.]|uniref:response regulator n=1 Tax=uncultured Chryseobacterium sp. TaxID=259322 RepID=UPI0025F8D89F|nr:response regulator [uncultured Chryseobacterium sp.]